MYLNQAVYSRTAARAEEYAVSLVCLLLLFSLNGAVVKTCFILYSRLLPLVGQLFLIQSCVRTSDHPCHAGQAQLHNNVSFWEERRTKKRLAASVYERERGRCHYGVLDVCTIMKQCAVGTRFYGKSANLGSTPWRVRVCAVLQTWQRWRLAIALMQCTSLRRLASMQRKQCSCCSTRSMSSAKSKCSNLVLNVRRLKVTGAVVYLDKNHRVRMEGLTAAAANISGSARSFQIMLTIRCTGDGNAFQMYANTRTATSAATPTAPPPPRQNNNDTHRHHHCERPACTNAAELETILAAASASGCAFMEAMRSLKTSVFKLQSLSQRAMSVLNCRRRRICIDVRSKWRPIRCRMA